MEGSGKGGNKPQQQNKPKQNKPQNKKGGGGGGGGGNKGQGKPPGNQNTGGPKPSQEPPKVASPEVISAAPQSEASANLSSEVATPVVLPASPPAAEVLENADASNAPTSKEQTAPSKMQSTLSPEPLAGEGRDSARGNQQNKGKKSKSPAKNGPQNKGANSAPKNTQGPSTNPLQLGNKPEVDAPNSPDIKSDPSVTSQPASSEGKPTVGVPAAPQLSVATDQNKEAATEKSLKNNQNAGKNSKGGKGNKGGANPQNKNAAQPPAVPLKPNQPTAAQKLEKENASNPIPQAIQGPETVIETPKVEKAKSPAPKQSNKALQEKARAESPAKNQQAQSKNKSGKGSAPHPEKPVEVLPVEVGSSLDSKEVTDAQSSSKKAKSSTKGDVSSPKPDNGPDSGPQSAPSPDKGIITPVESPQSFADKAKSPAQKPGNKIPAEKGRAESPAKNQQKQPNKSGKDGTPQPDKTAEVLSAVLPTPPLEQSIQSSPLKSDLPKNQQPAESNPQPHSAPELKECQQKNKNQKKNQPAKNTAPPVKTSEPKSATITPSNDQPSKKSKSPQPSSPKNMPSTKVANVSQKGSSDEVVDDEDFEPLFSDLSVPPVQKSAPKEPDTAKQPTGETLKTKELGDLPKPAIKEEPKSNVGPPKPLIKDEPKEIVPETQKTAVKETPKQPAKQTPAAIESEDVDFDPLFSDLTDSTKALVGIACPFVDKFPPLSPPAASPKATTLEQKPQAPVGTPAANTKAQQQPKKSNSPQTKSQAPQSPQIIPTAPVEIKSPSAALAGSPLQGDSSLPESWRDKVLSDVKLSSSPKRSGSPKLSSSPKLSLSPKLSSSPKVVVAPLKKEECKDQTKQTNPNTEASPVINEPVTVIATPTEVPKDGSNKHPPSSNKNDKKPANQKSSPQKGHQTKAQEASKAPVDKKEDGASSTKIDDIANMTSPSAVIEVSNRLNSLEKENTNLKLKVGNLTALLAKLEIRVKELETGNKSVGMQAVAQNSTVASQAVAKAANAASQASANVKTAGSQAQSQPAKQEDDDDGVDLFASDSEEDEEANKIKEQRLAEYAAKKSKKPALIAKSSIILDIKPWDDETDMKEMERRVRLIEADGLLWGASKLVPLAYGIHKLQINCVVEDDKISVDWLQETIEEIEDYVQSVDIAAFNKI